MFRKVAGLVTALHRRIRRSLELRQYTPWTMAEYHRRQGAIIGERCYIIPTSLGTEPYLVKIGNHVTIASDVTFVTHDGAVWLFREEFPDLQIFGPIIIEDNCCIGQGAILFPNIRIGRNSVVGAGSVVISDIPPDTIAMGIPARPLASVAKYREKCLERWSVQRPPDIVLDPGEIWWTSKHFSSNREKLRRHLESLFKAELS